MVLLLSNLYLRASLTPVFSSPLYLGSDSTGPTAKILFPYAQQCSFKVYMQHPWTNTWQLQCSHLNIAQILPCKNLSKTGAHGHIWPGTNLSNILLLKRKMQNLCNLSMRTGYFRSILRAKLYKLIHKSSTFKGKCSVNAVNFICNL